MSRRNNGDPVRLLARGGGYTSSRSHAIDEAEGIRADIQTIFSDEARQRQRENRERREKELADKLAVIETALAEARRFMHANGLANRDSCRDSDRARIAVKRISGRYASR